jgi:hypothetical protein
MKKEEYITNLVRWLSQIQKELPLEINRENKAIEESVYTMLLMKKFRHYRSQARIIRREDEPNMPR